MTRTNTSSILKRLAIPCATAALCIALPSTAMAKEVRLMIDPGHGGKDPGAVSGKAVEKKSNLQVSKYMVAAAKRQGWEVKLTRKDDRFIDLNSRPAKAAKFDATAFVSVHSNSAGSKPAGHMTIYRSGSGKRLGKNIMRQLGPMTDYKDIGNRKDVRGLAVLRGADMPAVIVELLSVTNKEENAALRDPARQRAMAEAVIEGVADFHGVPYTPPTEKKAVSKSKAETPVAEKTPAPVKPAATPETTRALEPIKIAESSAAARTKVAEKPASDARAELNTKPAARRAVTQKAPTGDSGWFGRILAIIAR